MSTSATDLKIPEASSAKVENGSLITELSEGRSIRTPLAWYPRIMHATEAERQNVRLIGKGRGLHWPDVEEDISVESIVRGQRSMESCASLKRWLAGRKASRK